jgi:aspartokinase/homoserine dehydrogenase 1
MRVLNFGEQALSSAQSIKTLRRIVGKAGEQDDRIVLVVSSLRGMRGDLAETAEQAAESSGGYLERIETIREPLLEIIRGLFRPQEQSGVITAVQILLNDLEDILHGVQLIRECSPRTLDLITSFAAQISCILISRYLEVEGFTVSVVDNPGILLKKNAHGAFQVDHQASYDAITGNLDKAEGIRIAAGGVARTDQGALTALPPDGGDLTAALIAAAVKADLIEIWTDMDGVMSADPSYVEEAFVIPQLSYQEAMELSYFGARMIHSQSLIPAMEMGVPIQIRNLDRTGNPGTRICVEPQRKPAAIAGIASIEPVALVNIEGGGMVGVRGIAARIFATLANAAVNIIMISQASSEHSICVVFRQQEAERALDALREELAPEIRAKQIQNFDLRKNLAILAAIGENMRGTPGISGKLFSALGTAKINILAIAQGSSETNISFVIEKSAEPEALRTVHRAFLG